MGAVPLANDIYAGRRFQGICQRRNALIVNLVFGNHADGLRRFARRQCQSCGGTHGRSRIVIPIFGTQAAVFGGYADLFQFCLLHFSGSLCGVGQCAQAERQYAEFEEFVWAVHAYAPVQG